MTSQTSGWSILNNLIQLCYMLFVSNILQPRKAVFHKLNNNFGFCVWQAVTLSWTSKEMKTSSFMSNIIHNSCETKTSDSVPEDPSTGVCYLISFLCAGACVHALHCLHLCVCACTCMPLLLCVSEGYCLLTDESCAVRGLREAWQICDRVCLRRVASMLIHSHKR